MSLVEAEVRYSWMLLLLGCDDHVFPPAGGEGGQTWCGILASDCASCHSGAAPAGGLDLESDPWSALVDIPSSTGQSYVVPGDPDASYLVSRLEDPSAPMPPSGPLSAESIDIIRQWIADGAESSCETTGTGGEGVHPPTWPDPLEHGTAAKLGELACATAGCHSETLTGDAGPSCASCHDAVVPDWTTSCTFCHGDRATGEPAPPEDIDDTKPGDISFPAHLTHLADTALHDAFACTDCHVVPTSVFSPGHLQFGGDETSGVAEVTFADNAISTVGSYSSGSCTVYCHGPSQSSGGTVAVDDEVECGDCHGVPGSGGSLTAPHDKHLEEGVTCIECHPTVNGAGTAILDPSLHVDGAVELELPLAMSIDNSLCTGSCHGEPHDGRAWVGDD